MRIDKYNQVGELQPSDLLVLWATGDRQVRSVSVEVLSETVRDAVFVLINQPDGLKKLGAAESGFNNSITGLGGIKTARSTVNLNACDASGWYISTSAAQNQPTAEIHLIWHLQSLNSASQIAIGQDSGAFYWRKSVVPLGGSAPVWSAWKTSAERGEVTAANLPGGTTTGRALMQASSAAAARTALGMSTLGQNIALSTDTASAQTTLGATATGSALFTAATAAAARLVLATSFGSTLMTQADVSGIYALMGITANAKTMINRSQYAEMRKDLGATDIGNSLFMAASTSDARLAIGATTTGNSLITAADAAAARTAINAMAADAAPTTTARGGVLLADALADLTAAPTADDFNALLSRLRTAGVITPSAAA